jgi:hypothetical protein
MPAAALEVPVILEVSASNVGLSLFLLPATLATWFWAEGSTPAALYFGQALPLLTPTVRNHVTITPADSLRLSAAI